MILLLPSTTRKPRTSDPPTSLQQEVSDRLKQGHELRYFHYVLTYRFIAVADVVRTSLGPRGMDKMVSSRTNNCALKKIVPFSPQTKFTKSFLTIDPRPQRKSSHHQRWSYHPQANGGYSPYRKNGKLTRQIEMI